MPPWLDDFLWAYGSFIYGLGVNAILGLSMYAVLALGQLSLGQAAFMGIGAYTSAVLTVKFGVPFPPPSVRGPFSLDDGPLLTSVLQQGGLLDVQFETMTTPMHAVSLEAWWERVPKLAGPLAFCGPVDDTRR